MLEVAHGERTQDFRSISSLLNSELDVLHELSVVGAALTGTPTGFTDLDAMTGGLQPGNLIVIAARPSMGKSASTWKLSMSIPESPSYMPTRMRVSISFAPARG